MIFHLQDQGHTRGVVYTQVVTLPAREQTIKPLFSLLTDTSFEYSVIKPHEAPIESSSATNGESFTVTTL